MKSLKEFIDKKKKANAVVVPAVPAATKSPAAVKPPGGAKSPLAQAADKLRESFVVAKKARSSLQSAESRVENAMARYLNILNQYENGRR